MVMAPAEPSKSLVWVRLRIFSGSAELARLIVVENDEVSIVNFQARRQPAVFFLYSSRKDFREGFGGLVDWHVIGEEGGDDCAFDRCAADFRKALMSQVSPPMNLAVIPRSRARLMISADS